MTLQKRDIDLKVEVWAGETFFMFRRINTVNPEEQRGETANPLAENGGFVLSPLR